MSNLMTLSIKVSARVFDEIEDFPHGSKGPAKCFIVLREMKEKAENRCLEEFTKFHAGGTFF